MKIEVSDDIYYSQICNKYNLTPLENTVDKKRALIEKNLYKLSVDEAIEMLNRQGRGYYFVKYSDDKTQIIDTTQYGTSTVSVSEFREILDNTANIN